MKCEISKDTNDCIWIEYLYDIKMQKVRVNEEAQKTLIKIAEINSKAMEALNKELDDFNTSKSTGDQCAVAELYQSMQ